MVVGMTSIALLAQLERGECKNTRNAKKIVSAKQRDTLRAKVVRETGAIVNMK